MVEEELEEFVIEKKLFGRDVGEEKIARGRIRILGYKLLVFYMIPNSMPRCSETSQGQEVTKPLV
jgi:hypothetical protein